MTEAALFRRCRRALGLSLPAIARALLIAQDRTIRRWAGPLPETPADQQRARDRERIKKAFPEIEP